MLMPQKHTSKDDGFVAIIVAAIIMVILSLITIGFTRIVQRDQRQSLDRQLTRQALYAAESGVNAVFKYLQDTPAADEEKLDCDTSVFENAGVLDADGNVAFTCATYDKTPGELNWSLSTTESAVAELRTASGNNFSVMTVRWGNEVGNNTIAALPACGPAANTFPAARAGNTPLLRLDLTNTAVLSRDSLIAGTDYLYIVPCNDGSASGPGANHVFGTPINGTIVQVPCYQALELPCQLTISNLNAPAFFARIRAVYDSAQVTITATEDIAGTPSPAQFAQAQTSIDVTARAGDVVRRLRVSLPLASVSNAPESVFQAFDGVCKLLSVDTTVGAERVIDNCTYPAPPGP